MAGALIEIGFEGGHGTAAGMASTFEEFGFPEGADLSIGLATVGLLFSVIPGIALLNYGIRTGKSELENRLFCRTLMKYLLKKVNRQGSLISMQGGPQAKSQPSPSP